MGNGKALQGLKVSCIFLVGFCEYANLKIEREEGKGG
jgi:hypothetical protein